MSAGVIRFTTSTAAYPSIRSAPTLKIWITPRASVAMLEKLALLKIASCSAPVLISACWRRERPATAGLLEAFGSRAGSRAFLGMADLRETADCLADREAVGAEITPLNYALILRESPSFAPSPGFPFPHLLSIHMKLFELARLLHGWSPGRDLPGPPRPGSPLDPNS